MKSKKRLSKETKWWAPTERMYKACSYCFENEIKAYIKLFGDKCSIELNYKGKIKNGEILYETQREAGIAIWKLYDEIFLRLNKNL